jgi:8-oxo-dGTP pyrophosphatase MutT (NUDIX family)
LALVGDNRQVAPSISPPSLETRDWAKFDAERDIHGHDPHDYDKALRDEFARGQRKAVRDTHRGEGKLSDSERQRRGAESTVRAVHHEGQNQFLKAAFHRGMARGYLTGHAPALVAARAEIHLDTRNWQLWDEEHPWVKKLKSIKGKGYTPEQFDKLAKEQFPVAAPFKLPAQPLKKITEGLHQGHGGLKDSDLTQVYREGSPHPDASWGKPTTQSRYGVVTFDDKGNVLLRKPTNNYDGFAWTFSKGHPDKGEHPVDAALRETLEETGHKPAIVGHISATFGGTGSTNHFYLGHDTKGIVDSKTMTEDGETEKLMWANPAQAVAAITQSTNKNGRYRDIQTLKAAYDSYSVIHPELHLPTIVLPPAPPVPNWKKGGLFNPTDKGPKPVPYKAKPPSFSHGSSTGQGKLFSTSATPTAAENFLAAAKKKAAAKGTNMFDEMIAAKLKQPKRSVSPALSVRVALMSKGEVHYRHSGSANHSCHTCAHRIDHGEQPSTCERVQGTVKRDDVCDLFEEARDQGDLDTRDWTKWNAEHKGSGHKTPEEFNAALKEAFKGGEKEGLKQLSGTTQDHRESKAAEHRVKAEKAEAKGDRMKAEFHRGKSHAFSANAQSAPHGGGGEPGRYANLTHGKKQTKALFGVIASMRATVSMPGTRSWVKWDLEHEGQGRKMRPEEFDKALHEGFQKTKIGDLKDGDHVLYGNGSTGHLGPHKVIAAVHTGNKSHLILKSERTGETKSLVLPRNGKASRALPETVKRYADSHPSEPMASPEEKKLRRSHRDVIAKAQAHADQMPHGKAHTSKSPMTDAQYAAHRDHVEYESVRHGADDLENSPFSSHISEDRVDGKTGKYTAERAKQQREIIDAIVKKAENVPSEHKALIMGGLGGAGKSTILRRNASSPDSVAAKFGVKYASYAKADDPAKHIMKGDGLGDPISHVTLNPDDIKEEMARRGMVPTIDHLSPMEAAGPFVHEEASMLAERVAARMTAQGKNVIWDVTLNSVKSGNKRADPLHNAPGGYHVGAAFVDVSRETSMANAEARHRAGMDAFNAGKGLGGRFVPSDLLRKGGDPAGVYQSANRASFEKLKAAGTFDHTLTVNNEGHQGKILSETGKSLVTRAIQGDDIPSDHTGEITEMIQHYKDGGIPFPILVKALAQRTYKVPTRLNGTNPPTNMYEEDQDFFEPDTWGEVDAANDHGLLTDDEYAEISSAADRFAGR